MEPRPTNDQARWMNSVLDKERAAPEGSCIKSNRRQCLHTDALSLFSIRTQCAADALASEAFLMRPGGVVLWDACKQR